MSYDRRLEGGREQKEQVYRVADRPLDGNMKMPGKFSGSTTEAQWRAVLQRLSLRFRLGDRVDSNDSAMPSGGARPPRAVAGNDCF